MKIKFIFLHIILSANVIGQSDAFLKSIRHKVNYNIGVKDEEIFNLMDIVKLKTDKDSARVEAVYLLDKINCDTCIMFLINHVNEPFSYGEGISDLDQMNSMACWHVLISRHSRWSSNSPNDIAERWRLFSLCLKSLHESVRDETFLIFLVDVFTGATSKDMYKTILLDEKKRNKSQFGTNSAIYDINLTNTLKLLD
jgi:hypothetical protein